MSTKLGETHMILSKTYVALLLNKIFYIPENILIKSHTCIYITMSFDYKRNIYIIKHLV